MAAVRDVFFLSDGLMFRLRESTMLPTEAIVIELERGFPSNISFPIRVVPMSMSGRVTKSKAKPMLPELCHLVPALSK
jgi:hypothetical protein